MEVTISLNTTAMQSFEDNFLSFPRFPEKMTREQFYPVAYRSMYLSRQMDEKFKELFRKGYVKGTVILSNGNEATTIGMSMPFRPGKDIVSLAHRDIGAHLMLGATPLSLMCQYMANEKSPTHGREGNVHHGNAATRRFPMISHIGDMLSITVGAVWGARKNGENVVGLSPVGDGATSTGDFHESINIASVRKIPVLFMIENNHYAYSTPTRLQYNCQHLSDRALGYGISGRTIDGTDVWEVYSAVYDAMVGMTNDSLPRIIESMTLRLEGHAAYDKAEYVSKTEYEAWMKREPLMRARQELSALGYQEDQIADIEKKVITEVDDATREALSYHRPSPDIHLGSVYAPSKKTPILPPFKLEKARNLNAVNAALDYILQNFPSAVLIGQDIGVYGSAFKTCKGLYEKYGADRVIDMPVAEAATVGTCLGASQTGMLPIMEFQFADFATEATTQLGLNSATWFFRTDKPAQLLFRMPCGAGITLGAFHSGEFEGLWSRFPGLKVLYPVTPQETFEALIAGFIDPNPCIVLEHKLLYGGRQDTVEFDGNCAALMQPRKYTDGAAITVVSMGAMVETVLSVVKQHNYSAEVWNPFILSPLNLEPIIESVRKTGRLLVVQESGASVGSGDKIISRVCREAYSELHSAPRLVSAPDAPVPFAKELELSHIPNAVEINQAIAIMIGETCE
jgi:2-oxoisovalerate dehydrogenase E1 component